MSLTRSHLKRLVRRTGALAAVAAVALPAAFFLAGCGKVTSTEIDDGGGSDVTAIVLRIEVPTQTVAPGGELRLTIRAVDKNGYTAPEGTIVSLTQEPPLGHINPPTASTSGGQAFATFIAGTQPGRTVVKASNGGALAQIEITVGTGTDPTPPPPGPGPSGDVIDLRTVTFTDANPSAYPVTARLEGMSFKLPNVCWTHASWPSNWPPYKNQAGGANANQVVFAKVNGRWYGGAWEALDAARYNGRGACRVLEVLVKHENLGPFGQVEDAPFFTWYPKSGEEIGFMMTTFIRNFQVPKGATGRSPVVMARWP